MRNTFRTDVNVKAYENRVRKQPRPYESIHTVQVSQIYCKQNTWRFLGRKTSIHNFSCVVCFKIFSGPSFTLVYIPGVSKKVLVITFNDS